MQEAAKEVLFSCPLPRTDSWENINKLGRSWESSAERDSWKVPKESDPVVSQTPSRSPPKSTSDTSLLGSSQSVQAPEHSMYPQPCGWLPWMPYGGDTEFWKMPSEHMKKLAQICRTRRDLKLFSSLSLPLAKQERNCQHLVECMARHW